MRSIQILLIEDNRLISDAVKLGLEKRGYKVDTCATLDEGRQLLSNGFFDLVITDWFLPDGQGKEILTMCARSFPHIGTIVYSEIEESDPQATAAGVDAVVEKGIGPNTLFHAVQRVLSKRKLHETSEKTEKIATWFIQQFQLPEQVSCPIALSIDHPVTWRSLLPLMSYWANGDAVQWLDARQENVESALFGSVRRNSQNPCGFLEDTRGSFKLLLHAQCVDEELTKKLILILKEKSTQRQGSEEKIPATQRLILVYTESSSIPTDHPKIRKITWDSNTMEAEYLLLLTEVFWSESLTSAEAKKVEIGNLSLETIASLVRESGDHPKSSKHFLSQLFEIYAPDTPSESRPTLSQYRNFSEANYMRKLLRDVDGNVGEAASIAGVMRQRIYKIIEKHNLSLVDFKD